MKVIKNKKGFTLIELLAVIIILSVLMLIAVPGILRLMDNSRENAFVTQAQMVYRAATEQFVLDSTDNLTNDGITYCKDVNNTTEGVSKLELSGSDNVYYKIKIDAQGKVLSYHVSNGIYSVKSEGSSNMDISSIDNDKVKTGSSYEEVSCAN